MGVCLSLNSHDKEIIQEKIVDEPMTEYVFNQMSKIPGFNTINGYNYPEYLIKWVERSTYN